MQENVAPQTPGVRSIGIKYGFISTLVAVIYSLLLAVLGLNPLEQKWGYFNLLVLTPAVLILAHKAFKDSGDGYMSYGQGVGISFWIALVGVVVGGTFVFCYLNFIDPSALEMAYDTQREAMSAKGMSDDQIEMGMSIAKKLFWPSYFIFGILAGVLGGVIVSIFTQKKNPEPTF